MCVTRVTDLPTPRPQAEGWNDPFHCWVVRSPGGAGEVPGRGQDEWGSGK